MHFGQVFRESQAEAGAAVGAEGIMPYLAEGLQDLWNVPGGDADPGIRHSEGDAAWICFLAADRDCAAFGSEANRVGKQVDQDLPNLPRVRLDLDEIGRHVVDQYLILGICVNGGQTDGFFDR